MARSFTLKVTAACITMAARENSVKCMIAQSVKEMGGRHPVVTRERVSFNLDGTHYSYPLPAKAAVELIKFDEGKAVNPFVIQLHGATATTRPVQKSAPKTKKKNVKAILPKGARKKRSYHFKDGPHRGFRRADGLRMIEVKE